MRKTKRTDEKTVETKDIRNMKQRWQRRMPTKARMFLLTQIFLASTKAAKGRNKKGRTRTKCRPGRFEYNTRRHAWCDTCETVRCTRHWSGWSTTCACRCRARTSISTLRLLLSTRTWGTRSLIKRFNCRTSINVSGI